MISSLGEDEVNLTCILRLQYLRSALPWQACDDRSIEQWFALVLSVDNYPTSGVG